MDPKVMQAVLDAKVYDLGHPFFVGMPRRLTAAPFVFTLIRSHMDTAVQEPTRNRTSSAAFFGMGDHCGTHIDAFSHVAENGKVYGHEDQVLENESYHGVRVGGIEETLPIVKRGVFFDIPLLRGVEVLGEDGEVTAADLEEGERRFGVKVREGDAVLVRTGWARYFLSEPHKFNQPDARVPGVGLSAAQWLGERKIFCTGADQTCYEKNDKTKLGVHLMFLPRLGIQIMETLNFEGLARDQVYEFLFVALPLRIIGASASPIRPIAIA